MRPVTALLATLALSSPAHASGYYYSDSGIVATGRGGAWIAGADTQFAQYYNPAGLIRIDRPTFNLGYSAVQQNVDWQQAKAEGGYFPEQKNAAAPFSVPQIGYAMPVGDKAAFAFGFMSPFAPASKWDRDGPQRYNIIDSAIYQFGVGPSIAVQPIKQLTFGVGAQWSYILVGRSLDLTILGTGFAGGPEEDPGGPDPGGDVFVDVTAKDVFTPSFNLGVLIEPDEMLSIGASVTPPTSFTAKGPLDVDFAGNAFEDQFASLTYTDEEVSLQIKLPTVVRAGVALRPTDKLEIELAWVWQQWSSLSEIIIDDVALTVDFAPGSLLEGMVASGDIDPNVKGPFALPAGLHDAASYRLGGEYRVTDGFEARLGGFYEPTATPEDLVTIALVDTSKVQVGGGASAWMLKDQRLRADMALAWIFFSPLDIKNSSVKQVNAEVFPECGPGQSPSLFGTDPCVDLANTGNGKASTRGWILGFQLQYALGSKPTDE